MNQTEFSLRTASPLDIDFIMKVESESFIKPIQEERSVFLKRIEVCPHLFLILEISGKPVGYLCAEILKSIPQNAEEIKLGHEPAGADENCKNGGLSPQGIKEQFSQNYVYISSFAILPEVRGNSSGKRFWNLSIEYFVNLGYKNFLLLVNEEWKGAVHIYEQSGFKKEKIFKDFFPAQNNKTNDGFLMSLVK